LSEKSLGDLEEVLEFYAQQASFEVATKIIGKFLEKPEALLLQPEMGPVEGFKTNLLIIDIW
jgi:plasmid stabilization system protein ParE